MKEMNHERRGDDAKKEFAQLVLTGGSRSFCISCDDLLRWFVISSKRGSALKIYCNNSMQRKQLHLLCDRYGLGHKTTKVSLQDTQKYAHMSHQELRELGLMKRARNGCVAECCGYEVVHGKIPMLIYLMKEIPLLDQLPDSVRALSGANNRQIKKHHPLFSCNVDLPVLPRDCLCHIFSYLATSDVINGCLCCKHWNTSLMGSVSLWKALYIRKMKERKSNKMQQSILPANAKHLQGSVTFFRKEVLALHFAYCTSKEPACRAACKHQHVFLDKTPLPPLLPPK
jgi:hypothetical protein